MSTIDQGKSASQRPTSCPLSHAAVGLTELRCFQSTVELSWCWGIVERCRKKFPTDRSRYFKASRSVLWFWTQAEIVLMLQKNEIFT